MSVNTSNAPPPPSIGFPATTTAVPTSPSSSGPVNAHDNTLVVIVAVAAVGALLGLFLLMACCRLRIASRVNVQDIDLDTAAAIAVVAPPPSIDCTSTDNTTTNSDVAMSPTTKSIDVALRRFHVAAHRIRNKKPVAQGTHCVVACATYDGTMDVALKTPLASRLKRADAASTMATFAQEILLCARLQHKYIVGFVGVLYRSPRDVTLVTEYMAQGNLASLLGCADSARFKWLSAKKAPVTKLAWAIGVVDALAYMHELGVTHRGLRAKNVLLTSAFGVKLGDMGLTRDTEVALSLTNTHSRTAGNIAPELLQQAATYSTAADMYAFGAFLCELDTCKPPFSSLESGRGGLDNTQIALLVGQGKMQPKFSYSCPDPILEIATRCMDFRPSERPSAIHVLQDLEHIRSAMT
ncbi:Aste57867_13405 [Aphanomyces stellatus]|uniref:Aste57867_13405 protein n=1 Tax=Aphanomyces stellatus TaxID=120398 RepID=A0A485KYJ7_9STRA|nr:hypothetical protein As57867_013355 [Aphanomyces stellatus]VFT90244.1 Aste57867_13405 [Aphanomyces stellatus]